MKRLWPRAALALAFVAPVLFACALYFSTSNRDGRGSPAKNDDRIIRLVP